MKKLRALLITLALMLITAAPALAQQYTLGIEDIIQINVLQPEEISVTVTVAPDGTINFPYIGIVNVASKSLDVVQDNIQERLADGYMKYPVVSVTLVESRSRKFFVYGAVVKPGTYPLEKNTTVFSASFNSSSRAKIRPTLSSTLAIIAAYVGLLCPPTPAFGLNFAINSSFA